MHNERKTLFNEFPFNLPMRPATPIKYEVPDYLTILNGGVKYKPYRKNPEKLKTFSQLAWRLLRDGNIDNTQVMSVIFCSSRKYFNFISRLRITHLGAAALELDRTKGLELSDNKDSVKTTQLKTSAGIFSAWVSARKK